MHPTPNTSALLLKIAEVKTSGAMNPGVPHLILLFFKSSSLTAKPKSEIQTSKSPSASIEVIKIFYPFRSL